MLKRLGWPGFFLATLLFGCGSAPEPTVSESNGALTQQGDHADHRGPYPAFQPDAPQIVNNGGTVMTAPVVVTVTWDGDANRTAYEALDDSVGRSRYWREVSSEYGVGAMTSRGYVHVATPAPKALSQADLEAFLLENSTSPGWPAWTTQTLYAVYLPPETSFTFEGQDACPPGTLASGYHFNATGGGRTIIYAVIAHCPEATLDLQTEIGSHELNEAATDPIPFDKPAYAGFDPDHLAYEFLTGYADEIADACAAPKTSYFEDIEPRFDGWVQRQWSNKSAREGHDPCVPRVAEPYFNVTTFPREMDTIKVDLSSLGYGVQTTKGVKATLDHPRTFDVGFYSDAPTGGPWTVSAVIDAEMSFPDSGGNPIKNGAATVVIDKVAGTNGDKAHVTITPSAFSSLGTIYVELRSTCPHTQTTHTLPLIVSDL
jgi:hypothetical protein